LPIVDLNLKCFTKRENFKTKNCRKELSGLGAQAPSFA
jgi:hypothetical protein